MRILIPIIILSTFLSACKRDEGATCNQTDSGNGGSGNGGDVIISAFNFLDIKKSTDKLSPSDLIFSWTGDPTGIDYSVCVYDINQRDDCHALPLNSEFTHLNGINSVQLSLESLVAQADQEFFILAKKNGLIPQASRQRFPITTEIANRLIQYVKASNTGENDEFGYAIALSQDGKTLAVGALAEDSSSTGINAEQVNDVDLVQEIGAVYIFRHNAGKWSQQAYLKASNAEKGDKFGSSLAISADGNRLAVGAVGEDSGAKGVNQNQTDNAALNSGAVYVFSFDVNAGNNGAWAQEAYIKASNTEEADAFGFSVSFNQDASILAVGANMEDSASVGVNGDPVSNTKLNSGAVYLYGRTDKSWQPQAYIKASNSDSDDLFGTAVDFSGNSNRLVVGAPGESSALMGTELTERDQLNNFASLAGAVYIFDLDSSVANTWSQTAYIKASNTGLEDYFGGQVQLSADGATLAVSAHREDSNSTGINGVQERNELVDAGATYVFRYNQSIWTQQAYIKPQVIDAGDQFGYSIALSADGNTLAVGADQEDSMADGLYSDPLDASTDFSGAAYLFSFDGAQWAQRAYLKAPNSERYNYFGQVVTLSGDGNTLAVSALLENSGAVGVNGDLAGNLPGAVSPQAVPESGAVYLF